MTEGMTHRVLLIVLLFGAPLRGAEAPRSDARALNALFVDEHLAANVLEVCSRATELPLEDRFEWLADCVLPGEQHPTFRVVVDFTPTDPAPIGVQEGEMGFRVPSGGEIVSPVLELIDTAAALGRLDELRQRISFRPSAADSAEVDRLALLALIDIAREDVPSAQSLLAEVLARFRSEESATSSSFDAVLLCVSAAANHPDLSRSVADAAYAIVTSYQEVSVWSARQRQFAAAFGRVRQAAGLDDEGFVTVATDAVPSAVWLPASLPRARFRGAGCPVAEWKLESGQVENLSSHDEDYLYFAVPLRGDFEVECDITAFGWRTSELFFGGEWIGLQYDLETFIVGDLRSRELRYPIAPPLTKFKDWIHYRIVERNGTWTAYVNGRKVRVQPLPAGHDPWLAVRSSARHNGAIRNLRVSGKPVVPEQLRLADGPELTGWIPYYDEPSWQFRANFDGSGEIVAPRNPEDARGCHDESALFYHRPILEDGSIEYEFWYEPGVCEAHAALDRLCFVLHPDGVKAHWLTDGPFDRTSLPPDNISVEPPNRRGPTSLPLAEQAWNHLRLTVRGDTVDLFLNRELIYQREIEPTNQRHFGLFHYVDRTELRVRNVTWMGDWPREIPGIDEQELAMDETGFLDERLPELTAVFSHDFAADGLPPGRFSVIQGELPAHITPAPDGLHMTRQGAGDGYITANIAPNLAVRGDFDITASFDRLVTHTQPIDGFSSNIFLSVAADTGDECLLMRRRIWRIRDQQIVQCQRVRYEDEEARRRFFDHQTVEAMSGTLRLARRGGTVYYLFAENDSQQFRLIGEESFPTADLPLQGVRLILQAHGDDTATSVVWKNLTVRAEELSGPAIDGDTDLFRSINQEQ